LDARLGEAFGDRINVYWDPLSVWWTTSFRSKMPSRWRVQMACSMLSSIIVVVIVVATSRSSWLPTHGGFWAGGWSFSSLVDVFCHMHLLTAQTRSKVTTRRS
jgi:hypothetical protein